MIKLTIKPNSSTLSPSLATSEVKLSALPFPCTSSCGSIVGEMRPGDDDEAECAARLIQVFRGEKSWPGT